MAVVESLNISPGGIPKSPQESVMLEAARLSGDGRDHEKHDRPWRAVSLLESKEFGHFREKGYVIGPGTMGENITVAGLDLMALMPGDRLQFAGGAAIEITEVRIPCYVLNSIDVKLKDDAWQHCGVMAKVVTPGKIRRGEAITLDGNSLDDAAGPWPHTAVILAGGKSTRMGARKESVRLSDGRTMLETIVESLRPVVKRIVVSGDCAGYTELDRLCVEKIPDARQDVGPLAGIDAVFRSRIDDRYLMTACDQPLISSYMFRVLTSRDLGKGVGFRDDLGQKLGPFPGIYPASWAKRLEEQLTTGDFAVHKFVKSCGPDWITLPQHLLHQLKNLNTPDDVAAVLKETSDDSR